MTEAQASPGTTVRAASEYCDRFGIPYGTIGTIVGIFELDGEQHLTIRWTLPGESRDVTGGVNITRGELGLLSLV